MFLPLDILFKYWIEHVTFGLLYAMFILSTRIVYREFLTLQLIVLVLGWGLLKLRSSISPYAKFSISQKYLLHSLNLFHIWQVSPQLSCGDTCQIWTWYSIAHMYFDDVENWENNGTEEMGLVTPTPGGWCRGVTTWLLYVGPRFGNLVLKW